MSVTVLSIEVKLERDQQDNKIKVYVKNPYSKDVDKIIELKDDDDSSFKTFTDNLAPVLTTLHSVLPHKSKSFFKSTADKEAAAEETRTAQEEILGKVKQEEPVIPTSDNEIILTLPKCGNFVLPGIDKDIKDKIQALINKNKENVNNEKLLDAKIDEALKKIHNEKSNEFKKYMDCASYLGQHLIKETLTDVFFTKDGIITDGYAILPFKITGTVDNPAIVDPGSIAYGASLWKLDDGVLILGNTIKLRFGVSGNTMYEVAVNLLKKYKTYETDNLTNEQSQKGTCDKPFEINDTTVPDKNLQANLLKLVGPPLSQTDINNAIDAVVENKSVSLLGAGDDKEYIKTYNKTILGEKCTINLGKHKIGGIPDTQVFMTKDGIITDGFAVLPLESVTDSGISDPDDNMFKKYATLWKLANKNKTPIPGMSMDQSTEYDVAVNKMKTEHKYGGSKTSSQRPIKTKSTRRIRPRKTKI